MSSKIESNLLIKTILSPVCDFSDAGAANKQTLVNRIKKLDQKERQALKEELDFLSSRMKAPEKIRDVDLKERGLCTLLLVEDGAVAKTHNCFVSFFLGIANLICRVGSSSLISQLESVRRDLVNRQGFAVSTDPLALEAVTKGLAEEVRALQVENAKPNGDEQLRKVIGMLEELKTAFTQLLSNHDVGALAAIVAKIAMIEQFVAQNTSVFTGDRTTFTEYLKAQSNLITSLHASATMEEFVASPGYTNAQLIGKSDCITKPKGKSDAVIKSELLEHIIVPSARHHIRRIMRQFQREIDSGSFRKNARDQEITTIQGRLLFMGQGVKLAAARKAVREAEEICPTWEAAHQSLNAFAQGKSFEELRESAKALHDLVEKTPGRKVYDAELSRVPAPKTFGQCLASLVSILEGDATKNGDLAKSLELDFYQIRKEREPGSTLHSFVENSRPYKLDTNEAKQKLAQAYIQYLQAVTEKKHQVALDNVQTKQKAVQLLEQGGARSESPAPVTAVPVPPPATPPPPPPPASPIPKYAPTTALNNGTAQNERQSLIEIAKAIEAAPAAGTDTSHYAQLETHPLREIVWKNFYFIALGAEQIQTPHDNWGCMVFHAKIGTNSLVKSATPEDLKAYRIRALLFAIIGITAGQAIPPATAASSST